MSSISGFTQKLLAVGFSLYMVGAPLARKASAAEPDSPDNATTTEQAQPSKTIPGKLYPQMLQVEAETAGGLVVSASNMALETFFLPQSSVDDYRRGLSNLASVNKTARKDLPANDPNRKAIVELAHTIIPAFPANAFNEDRVVSDALYEENYETLTKFGDKARVASALAQFQEEGLKVSRELHNFCMKNALMIESMSQDLQKKGFTFAVTARDLQSFCPDAQSTKRVASKKKPTHAPHTNAQTQAIKSLVYGK